MKGISFYILKSLNFCYNTRMKNFYTKSATIVFSLMLFVLIFGTGFFVGNNKNHISNGVSASEPINLDLFWKTFNLLEEKFVSVSGEKISDEDKIYGAISGLVESYGDPYTVFLPPEESEQFEETISGTFEGVGMEVGFKDGFLTVVSPLKNSPSEKAGIKSGDKIIAIDGETSMDITVDEAIKKIRGPQKTAVGLTIIREGEKDPILIEIMRDKITIPTLETKTIDDVFVISLYNFTSSSSYDFRNALRQFIKSKKNKLILDLRGNPGGFLESAIDIASWFLPVGKSIVIEDFGDEGEQKIFRSKGYDIFTKNLKMVVLIDGGSASASEIVAGALEEHGVAKLVGETTFGKGSVQELLSINGETSLKVTIAKWLTPNGKSISDGGLEPNFKVKFDKDKFDKGIDIQLQKAIEMLK